MLTGTPFIPETITVHLGFPDSEAPDVTVGFASYVKNVASSEIYPTWPESALRANIYAIVSFALNRIYTEWYRSRGYSFDITATTQFDQKFINGREYFENISYLADELFNDYVRRQGRVEPLFTAFCNGTTTTCAGLSQWGTVALANRGYTPYEILQYYYGDDIDIVKNAPVQTAMPSFPDKELKNGSVFAATDLVPLLTVDYQEATGTTQLTAGASADTFVRKGNKTNYGSNPTMELYTYYNEKEDGSVEDLDFAGLMSLQLPAAPSADDELQSATLRLVTERAKGSIALYPYEGQWAENAIYEEQATAIAEARAKEAIATVKLAGQSNKAVTDNGVTMNTVEEWTNLIDVTNYVKSLNGNNVNLLIVNPANTKTSVKVYTKEAADVTLKDGSVFAAADLVPQLMLTYKKKAGGETGISLNKNSMDKAVPQGIYTLSGQRVSKATRGIYIMNGRKVVVK